MGSCDFTWQIPIDTAVINPHRRRLYNIGLRHIIIAHDFRAMKNNSFVHVIIWPDIQGTRLWIGDRTVSCIKSLPILHDAVVSGSYNTMTTEYFPVDIRDYDTLKVTLIGSDNKPIHAKGTCVLSLLPMTND